MRLQAKIGKLFSEKTEAVVIGLFEKEKFSLDLKKLDFALNNEISHMFKNKEFKASFKELKLLNTYKKLPASKVLLIGLGKKGKFKTDCLRKAAAISAKTLRGTGVKNFVTTLQSIPVKGSTLLDKTQIVTEGMILGLYDFKKYITVDKDKLKAINKVTILESKNLTAVKGGIAKGKILANNVNHIRDLVNEPADKVTPTYLANEAKKIAKESKGKVKATVFGKKEITKKGMGALIGVSKGSAEEPKFIILDYKGANTKPIVFVGKGITFDSGGLDVKPAKYMEDMRCDMAGAATVLHTVKAAADLKLKQRVVAIVPTCENLLGSKAYKQGDILKAYNGKTIEVWHTDAEGRLVLADGLSYADKHYDAKAIIDIATLTGASVIALGYEIVSLISTNEQLKNKLLVASKKVDEMTWELPIIDDYKDLMKGDYGDFRNISKQDAGPGTITAGIFLSNFIEKSPWAHFDIGAAGWAPSDKDYKKKGGTGVCLRTFIQLIEDWKD